MSMIVDVYSIVSMLMYTQYYTNTYTPYMFYNRTTYIIRYTYYIGAINNNSTQAQIRRIIAITYAANFFFVCRVGIEISFLVALVILTISKCILYVYSGYI